MCIPGVRPPGAGVFLRRREQCEDRLKSRFVRPEKLGHRCRTKSLSSARYNESNSKIKVPARDTHPCDAEPPERLPKLERRQGRELLPMAPTAVVLMHGLRGYSVLNVYT